MSDEPLPLPALEDFEILEELGSGGIGVVYKARQRSLGRLVAIKMLRGGKLASTEERARFRLEAESLARLQHPNIVQVFEFGEHEGRPFLVCELAEGGTLAQRLGGQPRPPRACAQTLETLARTMAYAHARGIVHRDLKPENVFVTADEVPKIGDFGLALSAGSDRITINEALIGSPAYMAPEQAWGGTLTQLGPPADIYALGVMLFEMLTGRLPFVGRSAQETLERAWREAPPAPRRLVPSIPLDLEVIALKCLEKDPARRFGTAAELADELERWRLGEPIRSRPVGRLTRAALWARRNRAVAALLVALAIALAAGFAGIVWKYLEAEEQRRLAAEREREAEARRVEAESANAALREALYANTLALADQEWSAGRIRRAEDLLRELAAPGGGEPFELRVLRRRLSGGVLFVAPGTATRALAWSADGARIATGPDAWLEVAVRGAAEDARREAFPIDVAARAVSADGSVWAIAGEGGAVDVFRAGRRTVSIPVAAENSGNAGSGNAALPRGLFGPRVDAVALNAAGELVAAASEKRVVVASAADGRLLAERTIDEAAGGAYPRVLALAVAPKGERIAALVEKGGELRGAWSLVLWDAADTAARQVALPEGDAGARGRMMIASGAAAFTADGATVLASGPDAAIYAIDAAGGTVTATLRGHRAPVEAIAPFAEPARFASGGWDRQVRVWDLRAPGQELVLPQPEIVRALAVSPDGSRLACSLANDVRVLETTRDASSARLPANAGPIGAVAALPGEPAFVTGGADGRVLRWSLPRPGEPELLFRADEAVSALAVSHDGRRLAAAAGNDVTVYDLAGRRVEGDLGVDGETLWCVEFSPDGTKIACGDGDLPGGGKLHLFEASTRESTWSRGAQLDGNVMSLAFRPDGARIVAFAYGSNFRNTAYEIETASGRQLGEPGFGRSEVAFSGDGKRAAWAEDDRSVVVLDAAADPALVFPFPVRGTPEAIRLVGHSSRIAHLAFTSDGSRLAVAAGDPGGREPGELWIWDPRSGRQLLRLPGHEAFLDTVVFSSDGSFLISRDLQGGVRIW